MNNPDWTDKTILIAENEKINYLFMKTIFDPTGVNVLWARDGEEAVEWCRDSCRVDVVIMDIEMSDERRKEAARQIKVLKPDISVIAQTSNTIYLQQNGNSCMACDGMLCRPFKPFNLLALVEKHLYGYYA